MPTEVSVRLARIQGHLNGVTRMLKEGRPRVVLVHQIAAVRASLDSLVILILDDLISDCSANLESDALMSKPEELQQVLHQIKSARL